VDEVKKPPHLPSTKGRFIKLTRTFFEWACFEAIFEPGARSLIRQAPLPAAFNLKKFCLRKSTLGGRSKSNRFPICPFLLPLPLSL